MPDEDDDAAGITACSKNSKEDVEIGCCWKGTKMLRMKMTMLLGLREHDEDAAKDYCGYYEGR